MELLSLKPNFFVACLMQDLTKVKDIGRCAGELTSAMQSISVRLSVACLTMIGLGLEAARPFPLSPICIERNDANIINNCIDCTCSRMLPNDNRKLQPQPFANPFPDPYPKSNPNPNKLKPCCHRLTFPLQTRLTLSCSRRIMQVVT